MSSRVTTWRNIIQGHYMAECHPGSQHGGIARIPECNWSEECCSLLALFLCNLVITKHSVYHLMVYTQDRQDFSPRVYKTIIVIILVASKILNYNLQALQISIREICFLVDANSSFLCYTYSTEYNRQMLYRSIAYYVSWHTLFHPYNYRFTLTWWATNPPWG